MKSEDLRRYQLEEFNSFAPSLDKILAQVELTDQTNRFNVFGLDFMARQKGGVVEFGLTTEEPIFPTLTYQNQQDGSKKLLHYRIDNDLPRKIKSLAKEN